MAAAEPEEYSVHLLDLPVSDILHQHIFRRLPLSSLFQLRATCTALHDSVAEFFTTAKKIDLTYVPPKFGVKAFQIISKDAYNVRELIVRNSKDWMTDDVLVPVIKNNTYLEKVDLTNCTSLNHLSVVNLIGCNELRELYFRECVWLSPQSLMQLICVRGSTLDRIDLTGCWEINDQLVQIVANYCPK